MSAVRMWIQETIARLDGARERRAVALLATGLLLGLALGPVAIRAVGNALNPPTVKLDELGTSVANPYKLTATVANALTIDLKFDITPENGTTFTVLGVKVAPILDASGTEIGSRWEAQGLQGDPGKAYDATARGTDRLTNLALEATGIHYVIFDPNQVGDPSGSGSGSSGGSSGGGSNSGGGTPIVDILGAALSMTASSTIEAVGVQSGFLADNAFFRAESGSFLKDFPAQKGADGLWRATFAVPAGHTYAVRFIATGGGITLESASRDVNVPAPPVSSSPPPAPPPPLAPSMTILFPQAGASIVGSVNIAVRIENATAIAVIFEIKRADGSVKSLTADPPPTGSRDWKAVFESASGTYTFSTSASFSGFVKTFDEQRTFTLLAPETSTSAPAAPVATPVVELLAPLPGAAPFDGTAPLNVRVKNGLPDPVVFLVKDVSGAETLVLGKRSASGDFWTGAFDGPDGIYHVRARATVDGSEYFSSDVGFALKRTAVAAPVETALVPPPPPPPLPPPTTTETVQGELPPPPAAGIQPPPVAPPPPPPAGTSTDETPRLTTASAEAPPSTIPSALALECRAAGVGPQRCSAWLAAKYQNRDCLAAGVATREGCAELLRRENLPVDDKALYGLASRADVSRAKADAAPLIGRTVSAQDLPPTVNDLLSVQPKPDDRWRMQASASSSDSAPAMLLLDRDGDGLPDDLERRLGTDPTDPDTDDDGFSDGDEVKNGYNPLGSGPLVTPVRGVEKAIVDGAAIEEPRGADVPTDASFTVAADASGDAEAPLRLSGKAAPNSVVTIFVYSYLPVVITTTTDENGNWTYDFGSMLADGRHEAYVAVNDDTGKLVAASSPLSFFVQEAKAVSEADFVGPDVNVEETTDSNARLFLIGGGVLVLFALILTLVIVRQVRKDPADPAANGGGTL